MAFHWKRPGKGGGGREGGKEKGERERGGREGGRGREECGLTCS